MSSRESAVAALQPRAPMSVLRDVAAMWRFARQAGIARELKALHRPRLARSLGAAVADWMLIVLAAAATMSLATTAFVWAAVPVSLLVIGNRQRALGNLLHDASHWSLDGNRRRSRLLANLLFCWPLGVSMAVYRDEHNRHHKFLGDPARDPDFIHDGTRLDRGWFRAWLDQIRSPQMLRGAILGNLDRMDAASRIGVACWWAGVLALIALAAGVREAAIFLALWIAAKATVFHAITSFREISDHVGLSPGSLIGFSRNHPFGSLLGQVIHPHHNGYHLLHHLNPGIPFHALPRARAAVALAALRGRRALPVVSLGRDQRGALLGPTLGAGRSWQLEHFLPRSSQALTLPPLTRRVPPSPADAGEGYAGLARRQPSLAGVG